MLKRVGELQFLLKEHRGSQAPTATSGGVPKGLSRMVVGELMKECDNRGISTHDSSKKSGLKIREQMIRDITQYEHGPMDFEMDMSAGTHDAICSNCH